MARPAFLAPGPKRPAVSSGNGISRTWHQSANTREKNLQGRAWLGNGRPRAPKTLWVRVMAGIQTEVSLSRSQACQRLSHTTPAGARGGPETARDPSGFSSPSHEHPTSLLGSGRCGAQSCHQREVEVHRGKDEPRARLLQESQELRAMGPHCSLPVGPKDQMAQPSCPHDRRAHNTNACFP